MRYSKSIFLITIGLIVFTFLPAPIVQSIPLEGKTALEGIAGMIHDNKDAGQIKSAWRTYLEKHPGHHEDAMVFIIDKAKNLANASVDNKLADSNIPDARKADIQNQLNRQ